MRRKELQLASAIRHAVQTVIDRGLNDPRVSGLITVTEVRLIDDGRLAQIDVSVMPAEKQALTFKGLTAASGHIRQEIGKAVQGRSLPQLQFRLDQSAKRQASVLDAISKIEQERETATPGESTGFGSGVSRSSSASPGEGSAAHTPADEEATAPESPARQRRERD